MSLIQELKLVARSLRRHSGITLAVAATLALGIGANTAVFSLLYAVVLRPIHAAEPDRLVAVYVSSKQTPYGSTSLSVYDALRQQAQGFQSVAAYWTTPMERRDGESSEEIRATAVSSNYFATLGVRASLGRTIQPSDDDDGNDAVVVLSAPFWRSRFGGDPQIVGQHITVRGRELTIVGVANDDFRGTDLTAASDLWLPIGVLPQLNYTLLVENGRLSRGIPLFSMIGRLAPGSDRSRVSAEVRRIVHSVDANGGGGVIGASIRSKDAVVTVLPLEEAAAAIRDQATLFKFLRILVAVAVLTLALSCLNIGNLLVARARERQRELGVRVALGATRWRLARHLLLESGALGALGGVIGIGVAVVALRALASFTLPGHIAMSSLSLELSIPMLAFAVAISFGTALVVGAYPAWAATRASVLAVLLNRSHAGRGERRRRLLIAVQVAASIVLVVCASLLVRSVRAGLDADLGFPADHIAGLTVARSNEGRYAEHLRQYESVVAELRRRPGVAAAAVATQVPLSHFISRPFAHGAAPDVAIPNEPKVMLGVNFVTKEFFEVFQIPILQGRGFADYDAKDAPRALVVNEAAARALWPGESPLGKVVHAPWLGPILFTYTVVGVVRDSKYGGLHDDHVPFAYIHLPQEEAPGTTVTLVARCAQPAAMLPMMRETMKTVAPSLRMASAGSSVLPGPPLRLLLDQVTVLLAPQRFGASLLSGFAFLALCVSAIGIYGNVAYAVARRTTEIGIRMALGASSRAVLALVLMDAAAALAIGVASGTVGAIVASRLLSSLLYGIAPVDLASFAAGLAVTLLVAILAAFIPSSRSVRIDPALAMRPLS